MEKPVVRITVKEYGTMDVELYPDVAPISVKNFLELVEKNHYEGICFHRIIKDFMIQAGGYYVLDNTIYDRESNSTIKGEFSANGVVNNLKHEKGVISMARTNDPNSASAQFFICTATASHLDGNYAAFGKVIGEESYKVLDELNNVQTGFLSNAFANFPYPMVTIESIKKIN